MQPLQVGADEGPLGARVDERLVPHGGPAGLDQVAVGDGLEDVAAGSGPERLEEVLLVVVHRQDQDVQVGQSAGEFAGRLEAGHAGHGDVEDGQVHGGVPGPGDGLGPVPGLGDDRQVRFPVQDEAHSPAYEGVVVGEQHADRGGGGHQLAPRPDRWGHISGLLPSPVCAGVRRCPGRGPVRR